MFLITQVKLPVETKLGNFFKFGFQENSLGQLITIIIDFILIVAIILSLLFLLIGGITWITSGHDKAQLETARNRIVQAIIGLAITMAAWAIWILIVKQFLGIDITGGVTLTG